MLDQVRKGGYSSYTPKSNPNAARMSDLTKALDNRPDISKEDAEIIVRASPYTMTSLERLSALIDAVRFVSRQQIPGAIVECGVWRGGSMVAAAMTLLAEADTCRDLYLYDTYSGMSEPDDERDQSYDGISAKSQLSAETKGTGIWCEASLDDVMQNLVSTGYPEDKLNFIEGKVEDTIPTVTPIRIALLRLDTDWYESTMHELRYLYPLISKNGILIIDDYGHWKGAREACDEYFSRCSNPPFLMRIDYTGRIAQVT